MKNNNITSHIIILGTIILCFFSYVVASNILPENVSSNEFFSKLDEEMLGKIEKIESIDNDLIITASGSSKEICVKTTKSTPKLNSVCWNSVVDNQVAVSIYPQKIYYIWLKDNNNNISSYKTYQSK